MYRVCAHVERQLNRFSVLHINMVDRSDTVLSMVMGHYISNGVGELNVLWVRSPVVMLGEMPES